MNRTSIEWTHRPATGGAAGGFTWNPIRARLKLGAAPVRINGRSPRANGNGTFCTRISPGCTHCYASTINRRFGNGLEFTVPNLEKVEFFIDEKILAEPLKRKKPATIFVGDMFDLFHEAIPFEMIHSVFYHMYHSPQHTFQVLTKRAGRMCEVVKQILGQIYRMAGDGCMESEDQLLPNVWLGTSVESQKYADERIPLLLQTPAAVRFLSVEPMLEAVSFRWAKWVRWPQPGQSSNHLDGLKGIDWVICGGESGPGARPFNLAWAESLQEQCKTAGVPFFMKQVGSHVIQGDERRLKRDRKGGDMHEWPHELRVREFPV